MRQPANLAGKAWHRRSLRWPRQSRSIWSFGQFSGVGGWPSEWSGFRITGRSCFKAARHTLFLCTLLMGRQLALAQETVIFHNTGGGQPLVSEVQSLFVDATAQQPRLAFNFGFATDEAPAPGTFLDSFSVTIQDGKQSSTAVYLTADATGVAWAPVTPGTVFIDPPLINAIPITYPSLSPVLAAQRAFQVSAPIPSQFVGGSINVFFDLFDNLDAKASQGWFSSLSVVSVPEPQTWILLLAGVVFAGRLKRRKE